MVVLPKDPYLYFGNLFEHEPQFRIPNFVGLARHPRHDRDLFQDLRNPLGFQESSIRKIQAQDVFEHLPKELVSKLLDDIYRVLVTGGIFRPSVPDYRSPLLKKRSVYDSEGRILADLMMGGNVRYDQPSAVAKAEYVENGDAHIWFPTYEQVLDLIINSKIRKCTEIRLYHYFKSDNDYKVEEFPENEMPITRCPPRDMRASGKPISIIADFLK